MTEVVMSLDAKLYPEYECKNCKTKEFGEKTFLKRNLRSVEELKELLSKFEEKPPKEGIPEGWIALDFGSFLCTECRIGKDNG